MAHFARINEDNIVQEVLVVHNDVITTADGESEQLGIDFLVGLLGDARWVQTSYNGKFRRRFAGKTFKYDEVNDVFIEPQPYPSWTLDANFDWKAPKPQPEGDDWQWDEELGDWVNVEANA